MKFSYTAKLWAGAAAAAVVAFILKLVLPSMHPIPVAILVLGLYGVLYFVLTAAFGISEARHVFERVRKIIRL